MIGQVPTESKYQGSIPISESDHKNKIKTGHFSYLTKYNNIKKNKLTMCCRIVLKHK